MPADILHVEQPERVCGIHSIPREQCCPDRVTVASLPLILRDLRDELAGPHD